MKNENLENMKKCPRFDVCSCNICPLDLGANLRNKLPEENSCPFTIKKKKKSKKGIRTLAPDSIIKFIPKLNLKMLNMRNQKRWRELKNRASS